MFTALVIAAALQAPPVTRHFVLHAHGHATVVLHAALRSWSLTRGNVVTVGDIRRHDKTTKVTITATAPGATAITVGCDGGGREVWLVDVR